MKYSYTVRHKDNYDQFVFHVKDDEEGKWKTWKIIRVYFEEQDIKVYTPNQGGEND